MGNTNNVVSLDDARDKKQTEHEHTEGDVCIDCYEEHLKEKGVSNDGFYINPDYMTDEDEIVGILFLQSVKGGSQSNSILLWFSSILYSL